MYLFLRRVISTLVLAALFVPNAGHAFFEDLYIEDPNFKAIVFLRSLGIIEGYADNTFRPDQPVTRAEFTKLLVESLSVRPDVSRDRDCFDDVRSEWFAPYVCYAKNAGIVRGITPESFRPGDKVTRAEAIKMVLEGFHIGGGSMGVVKSYFSDVAPTDWYAGYIQRARLDNITDHAEFAFPNHATSRGMAAELLYRAMIMDLLDIPTFDHDLADQLLKQEFDIDLSTDAAIEPSIDNDEVALQLAIYRDVLNQLQTLHPLGSAIPLKDYVYASIEGLTYETGDPYTQFMRPEASEDFTDTLNGELTGIGVEIAGDELGVLVLNVLPGSPAESEGVKPGDIITHVGNLDLAGLTPEQVVDKMRGEAGTTVTIRYLRESNEQEVTLTRALLHIPSVVTSTEGTSTRIRLTQFGADTGKELHDVLTGLPESTTGLILDLRNNGGGYMDAAQTVAGFFLPENAPIFSLSDGRGNTDTVSAMGVPLTPLPMVVLVNEYSASAAEVVTGALRDHDRAIIVGDTTFGKGTVQTLINYTDGSMLRITFAQWLTPNGDSVGNVEGEHLGITPEVLVSDDTTTEADEQLEAALKLLP